MPRRPVELRAQLARRSRRSSHRHQRRAEVQELRADVHVQALALGQAARSPRPRRRAAGRTSSRGAPVLIPSCVSASMPGRDADRAARAPPIARARSSSSSESSTMSAPASARGAAAPRPPCCCRGSRAARRRCRRAARTRARRPSRRRRRGLPRRGGAAPRPTGTPSSRRRSALRARPRGRRAPAHGASPRRRRRAAFRTRAARSRRADAAEHELAVVDAPRCRGAARTARQALCSCRCSQRSPISLTAVRARSWAPPRWPSWLRRRLRRLDPVAAPVERQRLPGQRSESFRTLQLLSRATGVLPGPSLLVVATPSQAVAAAARLRTQSVVAASQPRAAVSTGRPARARDRMVQVVRDDRCAGVTSLARTLPGLVGGVSLANEQVNAQSERDLVRAELIAFPLAPAARALDLPRARRGAAARRRRTARALLDARAAAPRQRHARRSRCSRSISSPARRSGSRSTTACCSSRATARSSRVTGPGATRCARR